MNIYYTAYLQNNWKEVFMSHINLLKRTQLLANANKMFVHIYPYNEEIYGLVHDIHNLQIIPEIANRYEIPAIADLCNTADDVNLYLHTKGVTKYWSESVKCWREYMDFFVLENWKTCVDCLNEADAVGVNFSENPPHFSGNFWWATKEHIKRIDRLPTDRMECETWIGSRGGKFMSLHNSNINHYGNVYNKSNWVINKRLFKV